MLQKAEFIFEDAHYLVLNPMTGRMEETAVFKYNSREELMDDYNRYLVEPYDDTGPCEFTGQQKVFKKSFAKGSPFEWMNPLRPHEFEAPNRCGHGIHHKVEILSSPINPIPHFGPIPR